jgi:hypothetical protein
MIFFSGASGIYTMASDIDVANTLKVTNGSVIQSGLTLSVENAVTVASSGTLTLENNATLLQSLSKGQIWKCNRERNTSPVLQFVATFDFNNNDIAAL